jgi:hypothetical protein
MTTSTVVVPSHQHLGRIVLAVVVLAIALSGLVVVYSQRSSVNPTHPAVSTQTGQVGNVATCTTLYRHSRAC